MSALPTKTGKAMCEYVGEDKGVGADSAFRRVLFVSSRLLYSNPSTRRCRFDRAPVEMPRCMSENG